MKFGKEFKKQKVPEWTDAYMDYDGLKRLLREIHRFKQTNQIQNPTKASSYREPQIYRTFSGLDTKANNIQTSGDIEDQAIILSASSMMSNGLRKLYSTKFLPLSEEGVDKEVIFFEMLDHELNKVNKFYKYKVDEVLSQVAELNKQMEALIALRIKVKNPDFDSSVSLRRLSQDINSIPMEITSPGGVQSHAREDSDLSHGVDIDYAFQQEEYTTNSGSVRGYNTNTRTNQSDPLEILSRVKIKTTLETPISTIKGVLTDSRDKELRFKKEELKKVEARLRHVFVLFYQKLHLLKHFSFINLTAFSKIMKKYEKITSRTASMFYMRIVDNSFLGSSDEVTGLLERVESAYIKHFSNSNRREGMKSLRPKQKKEKHSVTFFSGFLAGCAAALMVAIVLVIESKRIMSQEEYTDYIGKIFPLYSFYACIVLHMLLYAANIYFWKRYQINYPFIFGFKQGTELGYREVFLASTVLMVLVLSAFLAHLHLMINFRETDFFDYIELIPLGLVTVIFLIVVCPFNILYRSSRYFLIYTMFRCICAPLYQVTLPDFFLADQLTSQIQAIRSVEYYICHYGLAEFLQDRNICHTRDAYNIFYFIVAVVPHWIRLLQCLRRLIEEKDSMQGFNGLRYFLTIVAVLLRTAFLLNKGSTWKVLAVAFSIFSTLANTYWDIVVDWGLLQRQSRNFLLRDKLSVNRKSVYFIATILDVVLRFAWLQLMLDFNLRSLRGKSMSSLFSFLEICRRGMWNFFRLENEHLNNVGKFRAFKSVPLPFNCSDDEDNDKDE